MCVRAHARASVCVCARACDVHERLMPLIPPDAHRMAGTDCALCEAVLPLHLHSLYTATRADVRHSLYTLKQPLSLQ